MYSFAGRNCSWTLLLCKELPAAGADANFKIRSGQSVLMNEGGEGADEECEHCKIADFHRKSTFLQNYKSCILFTLSYFFNLLLLIVVKRYEVVICGNEHSPDVTHLITYPEIGDTNIKCALCKI